MTNATTSIDDRQWFISQRWQSFDGEARANLLRIITISVFYAIELAQVHLLAEPSEVLMSFHRGATLLCVVWSVVAIATLACLRMRFFSPLLKYVITAIDIVLLSCLILLTERGPESPLVLVYFLILAMSATRFSLPLVWCATGGCVLGYLSVLAIVDMRSGSAWFDADHPVAPTDQLVTIASLVLTGIVVGQVIRRARTIATDYAQRTSSAKSNS